MKILWFIIVQVSIIIIVFLVPFFISIIGNDDIRFFSIVVYGFFMMLNGTFGQKILERLYEKMTKEEFTKNPFY